LSYINQWSRVFTLANRHGVYIQTVPAALKPTNDVTLSAWYRATEVDLSLGGTQSPLGSEIVSGANSYLLRLRASVNGAPVRAIEFSKRVGQNAFVSVTGEATTFLDGNWHHVAGVASRTGGVTIYYDGVEIASAPAETADIVYNSSAQSFWVGRHGDGQVQWDFGGNIDEVRVYTRALSPTEIADLAGGGNN